MIRFILEWFKWLKINNQCWYNTAQRQGMNLTPSWHPLVHIHCLLRILALHLLVGQSSPLLAISSTTEETHNEQNKQESTGNTNDGYGPGIQLIVIVDSFVQPENLVEQSSPTAEHFSCFATLLRHIAIGALTYTGVQACLMRTTAGFKATHIIAVELLLAAFAAEQDKVIRTVGGREYCCWTGARRIRIVLGGLQFLRDWLCTELDTPLFGLIPPISGVAGTAVHIDALAIGTAIAHPANWGTSTTHTIVSWLQLGVPVATGTCIGRYALSTRRTWGLADGFTVVAAILVISGWHVAGNALTAIWSGTTGVGGTAPTADGLTQAGLHLQVAGAALPNHPVGDLFLLWIVDLCDLLSLLPDLPLGWLLYYDPLFGHWHCGSYRLVPFAVIITLSVRCNGTEHQNQGPDEFHFPVWLVRSQLQSVHNWIFPEQEVRTTAKLATQAVDCGEDRQRMQAGHQIGHNNIRS